MQEKEQESLNPLTFDFLPEDLSEYLDDNYLDTSVLFDDLRKYCTDELNNNHLPYQSDDASSTGEAPCPAIKCEQANKLPEEAKKTKKRHRASPSSICAHEKKAKVSREEETNMEFVPVLGETTQYRRNNLPSAPTNIIHVIPSQSSTPIPIQFITLPDSSRYQMVQLCSSPSPVLGPPLSATPTYILVPTNSPPTEPQIQPHSPANGAVAPVLISSSPQGSRSDNASNVMSPHCVLPPSPSNKSLLCKNTPPSSTVFDFPQAVKDYIHEAKANMWKTCREMEAGLCLSSHHVDVRVSPRDFLHSGKNTNKCLEKEFIIPGDTDRQKNSLEPNQIFENSNGHKSKNYILLFGNAGMGKTTFIRKLCLDWSRDCISQFDFVFVLDGSALTLTEPVFNLRTLLLTISMFAPNCTNQESIFAQILAAPKRVLIIFDGFDEFRVYENLLQAQEKDLITSLQKDSKEQIFTVKQLYSALLQRNLLPNATLLLTSRPRGTATQLLRRVDSFLELSGFTPANVETYLCQYFTNPEVRASALDRLNSRSFLRLLCWNPGLCRMVCTILERTESPEALPRTLTGLCHQLLCLTMEKERSVQIHAEKDTIESSELDTQTELLDISLRRRSPRKNIPQSRLQTQTSRGGRKKGQEKDDEEECSEAGKLFSQLCSLAWEGVKASSSFHLTDQAVSEKLKKVGLQTGLLVSKCLKTRSEKEGEVEECGNKEANESMNNCDEHILMWANPYLQSYMAAVHLSLSRSVSDRSFLHTLPFQTSAKGRRRPQREEADLTQLIAVGLLFHEKSELERLLSFDETVSSDVVASKQALVTKHFEGLCYAEFSPAQVVEACNYMYEAIFTQENRVRDSSSTHLLTQLASNLPELLTFHGVPLSLPDVSTVQIALKCGGDEGRSFCLDLEESGVQICGLRALVDLNSINSYRACIADVISLWKQLELNGEEELLQKSVSKFKIHPLKATQVCHIEHLANLVNIHVHKRLSDSSSQSDCILTEGVPAVRELQKLEFELGPEKGPLALPKLWDLLPGLQNLQHLDLENSKIGNQGAERLATALMPLHSLEILNLSQNCIGDQGVKELAVSLRDLPKLHCLSLYSNVISDEGAESLAAVLPHMAALTDLDVKYNKLTDVGAQSLGASLRNCKKIKTLRMWNQCIPYGVFERLQQQDNRILHH